MYARLNRSHFYFTLIRMQPRQARINSMHYALSERFSQDQDHDEPMQLTLAQQLSFNGRSRTESHQCNHSMHPLDRATL